MKGSNTMSETTTPQPEQPDEQQPVQQQPVEPAPEPDEPSHSPIELPDDPSPEHEHTGRHEHHNDEHGS
jgi:hypothetical protein